MKHTPSKRRWTSVATEEAARLDVDPVAVMAGDRRHICVLARSRAFKRLAGDGYPYNGIGRVSGYHHTTIMHDVGTLALQETRYIERLNRKLPHLPEFSPIRSRILIQQMEQHA